MTFSNAACDVRLCFSVPFSIGKLQALLADKAAVLAVVDSEAAEAVKQFGDARRTELSCKFAQKVYGEFLSEFL